METYIKVPLGLLQNELENRIHHYPSNIQLTYFGKEFSDNLSLINRINHPSGYVIATATFTNCLFTGKLVLGDNYETGPIVFKECIFQGEVTFRAEGKVQFENNCLFKSNLHIYTSERADINLSGINFEKKASITGVTPKRVELKDLNLNQKIEGQILEINIPNCAEFSASNSHFKEINFIQTNFLQHVELEKIKTAILKLDNTVIDKTFHIKSSEISDSIVLINVNSPEGTFKLTEECIISNFNFPLSAFANTNVSDCTVGDLKLYGTNKKESILDVQKTTVNKLIFSEVYNNGLITLKGITIPESGNLSMLASSIGKTDFIRCNFSKAILEFENSKITEAFFADTDFPTEVKLNGQPSPIQAQLAFGQLAINFQKQGDTVRFLEYQSRELQAHYNSLTLFSKDFFKTLNLWLNLISNYFGRYWALGILFTFGVGILFFCFLLISTDEFVLSYPQIDGDLMPAFFKFMNPLRFFDLETLFKSKSNEVEITTNGWSYFWDFCGRVFIAYGVYQTIQAFRRYGRK